MWSGSKIHVSSSSSMALGAVDSLREAEKPLAPFEVFIELHLKERSMDGFLAYLLKWVEERKASIHLCCKKLSILSFPMENIMKVLSMVHLVFAHPGHVCSSPGPDKQSAETLHLPHPPAISQGAGQSARCENYISVPEAAPPPGSSSGIPLLP